jgi:enoyl-CoA hydratase/carnithine racemase
MSVGYRMDGEVAVVTLARPEKFNSVSADLSRGLVAAIARAGEEARAVILTGEGKAFCAGADLADLMADYETSGPDLAAVINDRFNPMVRALVDAPVPTIAAVNGVAAGAGLGLALACDLRVMSSQAFFLSAFIGLALIPDTGSTWMLVHHLGLARAIEFTATNRRMAADEVARLGLARITEPMPPTARFSSEPPPRTSRRLWRSNESPRENSVGPPCISKACVPSSTSASPISQADRDTEVRCRRLLNLPLCGPPIETGIGE